MFTEKDKNQIKNRGSQIETVELQIENFKNGFPFLHIEDAASVGNGIIRLNEEELNAGLIYTTLKLKKILSR